MNNKLQSWEAHFLHGNKKYFAKKCENISDKVLHFSLRKKTLRGTLMCNFEE